MNPITDTELDAALANAGRIRRTPRVIDGGDREPDPAEQFVSSPSLGRGLQETKRGIPSIRFAPVPIGELGPGEPPEWIWPGYVARGCATLLMGVWKGGKSTMLAHLLRDLGEGGGLVDAPLGGRALVLSEESPAMWARRRDELDIGDHVEIAPLPVLGRPTMRQWVELIDTITEAVRERDYRLVVLDTFGALSPVTDENNAAEMGAALTPLRAICEAGAGLVICHHPRKSDGGQATASRGSGALPAFVDCIVELRRFDGESMTDPRRTLRAYGRFDETPPETVIELTDGGYVVRGDRAEVVEVDRAETILSLLPPEGMGLTVDEVMGKWPGEKPGDRTLRGVLNHGANIGKWARRGMGRKNDPYRYRKA